MAKITGRVEVTVNGVLLLNKAGAVAMNIGESGKPTIKREPIMGDTGIHGDKETILEARLQVKVTDRDDVDLSAINAIKGDGTVVMRAAGGGKVYTMPNATCMGAAQLTAGEGETTLEFYGPYWIHTTA